MRHRLPHATCVPRGNGNERHTDKRMSTRSAHIYAECDGTNNPQLPAQRKQLKCSMAAVLLLRAAECSIILKRFFSGRKSNKVYKLFFEFICYFTEKENKKKKRKHNIASASDIMCLCACVWLPPALQHTTIKTPGFSTRFNMSFYQFVALFRNLQHAHFCVYSIACISFAAPKIRSLAARDSALENIHKTKFLR